MQRADLVARRLRVGARLIRRRRRPIIADALAGLTVALVLIPQSLAYADLAGLPAHVGLYAAALPLLAAAFFASSPYLQTGPVALTSLLTLSALAPRAAAGSAEYLGLAALLALTVGVVRITVGLLRAGVIAYLMSHPVMTGFTTGAGVLILASQVPGAVGVQPPVDGVLPGLVWTVSQFRDWEPTAVVLSVLTILIVAGSRRVHPLLPGVLLATALGIAFSLLAGYTGRTVGPVPGGLPPLSLDLPWSRLPVLLPSAAIIALVGFAEPASIARAFATQDRQVWNPSREFIGQGVANVVAGITAAFPVGGSFTRSALNRLAGARSRWSGAVTALVVLAFLPFAAIVAPLPGAVLSAIVIAAVAGFVKPGPILEMWTTSPPQFFVGSATFILTLALAPHIEWAVVIGILAAVGVHLWRELDLHVEIWTDGKTLHFKPYGVLWFGSAQAMERPFQRALAERPEIERLVVHAGALGRVDLTGAEVLTWLLEDAESAGIEVRIVEVHPRTGRVFERVLQQRLDAEFAAHQFGRPDGRPPAPGPPRTTADPHEHEEPAPP